LPLDPRFAGSHPVKDDEFLRAIKIRSTTSFGGEVKPSVPCKFLRHVTESYRYERRYFVEKFTAISRQVVPALLIGVSAGY
jgi:hypothetical protein